MSSILEYYNPFRNRLRKLKLADSLEVIHAFATHLCYNTRLPSDLEVPPWFVRAKHWHEKRVLPWELETLTAELLLHSPEYTLPRASFRSWNYFSTTINRIKDLEGALAREYRDLHREQILHELFRIAHRQFPWQLRGTKSQILRYLRLYRDPGLHDTVSSILGLTADDLFTIGLSMNGHFLGNVSASLPLSHHGLGEVTAHKLEAFLALFSTDIETIRREIATNQRLNEDYFYTFNPLRAKPLIVLGDHTDRRLVCPLPPLLLNAFTDGLYYRLASTPSAREALGSAFQQHVGDVLGATKTAGSLAVFPETEYRVKKARKDTVDWFARDFSAALFIEVKTKRVRWEAHATLASDDALQHELATMAGFVVQLYTTVTDFKAGLYPPEFGPIPTTIYPLVVTLEDWHMFGDGVWNPFQTAIQEGFAKRGLALDLLERHPFIVASIDEFEELAQRVAVESIESVLAPKMIDAGHRSWSLGAFFQNRPPAQAHPLLFEAEFDGFFRRAAGNISATQET